jgi:hypothetical protein
MELAIELETPLDVDSVCALHSNTFFLSPPRKIVLMKKFFERFELNNRLAEKCVVYEAAMFSAFPLFRFLLRRGKGIAEMLLAHQCDCCLEMALSPTHPHERGK